MHTVRYLGREWIDPNENRGQGVPWVEVDINATCALLGRVLKKLTMATY